jgi:ElaB/YqjD/DUF883 family membrane-anchored ribosome-binding protein
MPDTTDTATADRTRTAPRRAGRMESALATARGAANDAITETRRAARRAGQAAEANPLAVVAGGIAIGIAAGALLPKTKRETELLGPVGRRLTDAASDAATAAKDAARAELSTLPLSKEAARAQVGKVLDQVAKAVSEAGEAALAQRSRPVEEPAAPAPRPKRTK